MMTSDNLQRIIVYLTAALLALGAVGLAVWVWAQPSDPTKDFSLIFGFLGTVFGSASTFLFLGERSTSAAKTSVRAVEAGGVLGAQMPGENLYGGAMLGGMPDAVEDEYVPDGDEPAAEDPALVDPLVAPADRA
jgi:hypothetical protein